MSIRPTKPLNYAWPVGLLPDNFAGPNNKDIRQTQFYKFLCVAYGGWLNSKVSGQPDKSRACALIVDLWSLFEYLDDVQMNKWRRLELMRAVYGWIRELYRVPTT